MAILAMLSGWAYDAGRRIAGFDQSETSNVVNELRSANISLEEEVAALRSLLTASESSLQIERAAQGQLSERNSALALENARLKEDLAVFERLSRLEDKLGDEVSIDRLVVQPDAAVGRYRFSFLVALQGARRGRESALDMQIIVMPRAGSADAKIVLPQKGDPNAAQYKIAVRNFRRIEGKFDVPEGYPLGTVDVRIFEGGRLMVNKSVSL